jgi:hypothetical protein
MKIIHTSTFTIIHTNFNHYLETTQRKQRHREPVQESRIYIFQFLGITKYVMSSLFVFFSILLYVDLCMPLVGPKIGKYKFLILVLVPGVFVFFVLSPNND